MKEVSKDFYNKELKTLAPIKENKVFTLAFILSLMILSYFGYLILTKSPPTSENNFFDNFGYEHTK